MDNFFQTIFRISFPCFCFVMFSCAFPTGFSASLSVLSFLSALPLIIRNRSKFVIGYIECIGLILFLWLALSILWSEVSVISSFSYLTEYRMFFMIPIFVNALLLDSRLIKVSGLAVAAGCLVAMVASYGLGFGVLKVAGAEFSLANRIFHGFIMALFGYACLCLSLRPGIMRYRLFLMGIGALALLNVLLIEKGRTGYIQALALVFVFFSINFSVRKALAAGLMATAFVVFSFYFSDTLNARVMETYVNLEKVFVNGDFQSSLGYRLEFYRAALVLWNSSPILGLGVGDVTESLAEMYRTGEMSIYTDNVHGEFLNMLLCGGVVGLALFISWLCSFFYAAWRNAVVDRFLSNLFAGLGVLITISALFNSTIKDYGEKHSVLVMISIALAAIYSRRGGASTSERRS